VRSEHRSEVIDDGAELLASVHGKGRDLGSSGGAVVTVTWAGSAFSPAP
jgi:hypothetical protein